MIPPGDGHQNSHSCFKWPLLDIKFDMPVLKYDEQASTWFIHVSEFEKSSLRAYIESPIITYVRDICLQQAVVCLGLIYTEHPENLSCWIEFYRN
jgi:hypothetical protein